MNPIQYIDNAVLALACLIYALILAVAGRLVLQHLRTKAPAIERIVSGFQERQRQKTLALVADYEAWLVEYERWYIKHWGLAVDHIDLSLIAPSFDTWREAKGR